MFLLTKEKEITKKISKPATQLNCVFVSGALIRQKGLAISPRVCNQAQSFKSRILFRKTFLSVVSSTYTTLYLLSNHSNILFQSGPRPLLDYSGVPTLVLLVTLVLVLAATSILARPETKQQRLPGPPTLPFLGSRWLFWGRYRMNKLHEAYEGTIHYFTSNTDT